MCSGGFCEGADRRYLARKDQLPRVLTILLTGIESFQVQDKEVRPFFTFLNSLNELGLGIKQKGISTEIKSELSSAEPGCIISEISRANRKIPIIKRPDY